MLVLPARLRPKKRIHYGRRPPIHHQLSPQTIEDGNRRALRRAAVAEHQALNPGDTRSRVRQRLPAAVVFCVVTAAAIAAAGRGGLDCTGNAQTCAAPIAAPGDRSYLTEQAPLASRYRGPFADPPTYPAAHADPPGDRPPAAGDRLFNFRNRRAHDVDQNNRPGLQRARRLLEVITRALPQRGNLSDLRQARRGDGRLRALLDRLARRPNSRRPPR